VLFNSTLPVSRDDREMLALVTKSIYTGRGENRSIADHDGLSGLVDDEW
jgi:hypothetical protein